MRIKAKGARLKEKKTFYAAVYFILPGL